MHSKQGASPRKIRKEAGKNTQIFGLAMGGGRFFYLGRLRLHSLILRGAIFSLSEISSARSPNDVPPFSHPLLAGDFRE